MKFYFHPDYFSMQTEVENYINNFNSIGNIFSGGRNTIRIVTNKEGKKLNIKSFKKPNFINRFVYCYFRKSKAERSFYFGLKLLEKCVGTPHPIAYAENKTLFGLKESFYVSEQLDCDLTFRELVLNPNYPDHSEILTQFTKFSFELHQKGIEFLDHSPGNTLIKRGENGNYEFFLVDLNRMKFHENMSFEVRMKNLSHLTNKEEMVAFMSAEYAKLSGEDEKLIFKTLWDFTQSFQKRFYNKKRIKNKIFFWRKK